LLSPDAATPDPFIQPTSRTKNESWIFREEKVQRPSVKFQSGAAPSGGSQAGGVTGLNVRGCGRAKIVKCNFSFNIPRFFCYGCFKISNDLSLNAIFRTVGEIFMFAGFRFLFPQVSQIFTAHLHLHVLF